MSEICDLESQELLILTENTGIKKYLNRKEKQKYLYLNPEGILKHKILKLNDI